MKLNLQRPLIFFDLETTGTSITHDRIVEISIIKVMPDGTEFERTRRINPEMPIPAEATAIHHISDDDVANEPTFRQLAQSLAELFDGCDIAGFNSNRFDIPLLMEEFNRVQVPFNIADTRFIDVQTIFHKREPRTLSAAFRYYCDKNLDDAHSASADTRATYDVLRAQLDRYADLPNDIQALADYSSHSRNVDFAGRLVYDDNKVEIINFGKYKGKVAEKVLKSDPGYFSWIQQGDFSIDTKNAFQRIYLRMLASKRQ